MIEPKRRTNARLLPTLLIASLLLAETVSAATFVTNSPLDAGDANPGDGVCASILAGGPCTLRAAVQEANALSGLDTIELPTLLYTLNIPGSDNGALVGDLDIVESLVLRAIGLPTVIATHGEAAIELRSGSLEIHGVAFEDAGLSTLADTRSTLVEVEITDAPDGAVVNHGTMTIQSGGFIGNGNTTSAQAGAIDNYGRLLISRSFLWDNKAGLDGTGGIFNRAGAHLSASNVQLFGNTTSTGTVDPSSNSCASSIVNFGEADLQFVSIVGGEACQYLFVNLSPAILNTGPFRMLGSTVSGWDIACGITTGSVGLESRGYNTTSGATCGLSATGDDETGITFGGVPAEVCPIVDRTGNSRLDGSDCLRGSESVTAPACSNGLDDDGDGEVDLQDPGCRDASDPSESHIRPGDYVVANFDTGGATIFDPVTTRLSPVTRSMGGVTPWDIVVDASGEILTTDADLDSVTLVDLESGSLRLVSAGGLLGLATGLATSDTGEIFVAAQATDRIVEIDPATGGQSTVLADPSFAGLADLLFDPSDGSLLVSAAAAGQLHRVSDPFGLPSLSTFSTSLVTTPRQLAFDGTDDIIVSDQGVAAPLRFDPVTSTDTPTLTTGPFSSLQGAGVEPSGLILATDYTTGEIVRVSEAADTATVLNIGHAEPGLNHLTVVPAAAVIDLTLVDTVIVDGGTAGVADIGDTLKFTATVTNAGPSATDLLSFESGLDPNLVLVAGQITTTQGTILEGSLASDRRLEVDLGSLAPAATATVTWQVDIADPAPARSVSSKAWIRREKIILAESDDPSTGPANDPNVIGVGDYGVVVQAIQKISDTRGGLSGPGNPGAALLDGGVLGDSLEPLGDIDGDGVADVAVGSSTDGEAGTNFGAFHILLLNSDGSVKQKHKWSAASPDLATALSTAGLTLADDRFGAGISYLGDLDGAGPADFALGVSAWYDSGAGGDDRGAVYILFMDASPLQVLSVSKIGDGVGGFPAGQLGDFDYFGKDIENIGDVNGDGVTDLAVGAHLDDTIGTNSGGVWIVFLTTTGTVEASDPVQILVTPAAAGDYFGLGIASLGLFDGDSVPDIAVGATRRDTGGLESSGGIWILTLNPNGTIKTSAEIAPGVGGFPMGLLEADDRFGRGLETLPDLDGDGIVELVVGANRDADAGFRTGAAYAVFLTAAGGTDQVVQLAPQAGVLFNELDDDDRFGVSLASIGDLDGDGNPEIAAGAILDDDGGGNRGAVYVFHTETPVPEPGLVVGLLSGAGLLSVLARLRQRVPRTESASASARNH